MSNSTNFNLLVFRLENYYYYYYYSYSENIREIWYDSDALIWSILNSQRE